MLFIIFFCEKTKNLLNYTIVFNFNNKTTFQINFFANGVILSKKKLRKKLSKMEEEKSKDNAKLDLESITEQHACFDKNWILQLNKQESIHNLICLICKQVANSPMEINCIQHKNMDESLIVGENCLTKFLSQNQNSCPIEPHDNCLYSQGRFAKLYINELDVICPRQFQQEQHQLRMLTQQGHEERETPGIINCGFKGK
ncbi:hypothetical protein RFI_34458, partial [Reticulomyxa filosa]